MKDAKGHGSDPRGAHAQGVNQIGRIIDVPIQKLRAIQSYGAEQDEKHIQGIQASMRNGATLNPIKVTPYMNSYLISDGHHRAEAGAREGHLSISATVVSPRSYVGKSAIQTAKDYGNSPWKYGNLRGGEY